MKKIIFLSFILYCAYGYLYASSLNIETDYRNRVLMYKNIDFDTSTSTDTASYSTQRLRLSLTGTFDTGSSTFGEQIEICTRLQALEIVGSSLTVPLFAWQKELPYPRKDFIPFIENSYVKLSNLTGTPVEFTVGRQPLEYGSGLIVSDNGLGFDALRLAVQYPKNFTTDIFTAKITERFSEEGDYDLDGLVITGPYKNSEFQVGYFKETDNSGSLIYRQAENEIQTKSTIKQFYDFRIGKSDESKYWNFEIAFQDGNLTQQDNHTIKLKGHAYVFSGGVIQKKPSGATRSYRLAISVASGDDDITSLTDNDGAFSPTFGRKFDGLELSGYGIFLGLSPTTSLLEVNSHNFSGFNVFGLGATFSPVYGFEYGFDAFMFSASECRYLGGPPAGNFEKNILQTKYNLGNELNGFIKYSPSKYVNFKLSYARYTPPTYTIIWPKTESNDVFLFETNCKF